MRVLLIGLMVLTATNVYAGASFEVLEQRVNKKGQIEVFTEHKLDGVVVESRYPKDLKGLQKKGYPESLEGREFYITRYQAFIFEGMTDAEKEKFILDDVQQFTNNVVEKAYKKKECERVNSRVILKGKKRNITKVKKLLDTDGDNLYDTEITIKSDGSRTDMPITPTPDARPSN